MRYCERTRAEPMRTAEGKAKTETIRCLKWRNPCHAYAHPDAIVSLTCGDGGSKCSRK